MLNALIALLGDSFEKVQENKVALYYKERCSLICDYMIYLSEDTIKELAEKFKFIHSLRPTDEQEEDYDNQYQEEGEWQG